MRKINSEDINKVLKYTLHIGARCIVYTCVFGPTIKKLLNTTKTYIVPGYYDTINVIVDSDLWDHEKQNIINTLKPNAEPDYYEAVINIVKSDMWDHEKIKLIEHLSK